MSNNTTGTLEQTKTNRFNCRTVERKFSDFCSFVFVPKEASSDHQAWLLRCVGTRNLQSQNGRPYAELFPMFECLVCSRGPRLWKNTLDEDGQV